MGRWEDGREVLCEMGWHGLGWEIRVKDIMGDGRCGFSKRLGGVLGVVSWAAFMLSRVSEMDALCVL
jgi:hypothetical protein